MMNVEKERTARFIMALRARGVRDQRILNAFELTPREAFLSAALEAYAYEDWMLPIAAGQTIESPFTLARALEAMALKTTMKVLEVGTGTGFGTAILARLCRRVHTVERIGALHGGAVRRLSAERLSNVEALHADALSRRIGSGFDRILVHAAMEDAPRVLIDQLTSDGRLIFVKDGFLTERPREAASAEPRVLSAYPASALRLGKAA